MLGAVKGWLERVFARQCHFCDQPIQGPYVREQVKVPGYTGQHEKPFCSEEHLERWQDRVEAWEKQFGEVPMSNTGPACGGC